MFHFLKICDIIIHNNIFFENSKVGEKIMYGVLDIGSNTIRLVIYKIVKNRPVEIYNNADMACLASHRENGNITKEGIFKAVKSINKYINISNEFKVEKLFAFATASLRNVNNTAEAVSIINELTGIEVDVLSGEKEAFYDFEGTKFDTDIKSGVMLDIGGGSSEIVVYKDKNPVDAFSMPFGSLTLYNDFVSGMFPNEKEKENIENMVYGFIKDLKYDGLSQFCVVGGTAKSAEKNLLPGEFCPEKLISLSFENPDLLKKAIDKIAPKRANTIIPGIIVFDKVMKHFKLNSTVISICGVKEGYLSHMITL